MVRNVAKELELVSLVSGEEMPTKTKKYVRSSHYFNYEREKEIYDTSADAYFVELLNRDEVEKEYREWVEELKQEDYESAMQEIERDVSRDDFRQTVFEDRKKEIDNKYSSWLRDFEKFLARFEYGGYCSEGEDYGNYAIPGSELETVIDASDEVEEVIVRSEPDSREVLEWEVEMSMETFGSTFEEVSEVLELPPSDQAMVMDIRHFSECG